MRDVCQQAKLRLDDMAHDNWIPLQDTGSYAPERLSKMADRLAGFIVAMSGALFILVPMYTTMALRQSLTKNLITTTVAVVLFALGVRFRSSWPMIRRSRLLLDTPLCSWCS